PGEAYRRRVRSRLRGHRRRTSMVLGARRRRPARRRPRGHVLSPDPSGRVSMIGFRGLGAGPAAHFGGGMDDSIPRKTSSTPKSLPLGAVFALTSLSVTEVAPPEFQIVLRPSQTPSCVEVLVPRSSSFA